MAMKVVPSWRTFISVGIIVLVVMWIVNNVDFLKNLTSRRVTPSA